MSGDDKDKVVKQGRITSIDEQTDYVWGENGRFYRGGAIVKADYYVEKMNGDVLFYKADGKTLDSKYDSQQNVLIHYKADGKTVDNVSKANTDNRDFYTADGIRRTHTFVIAGSVEGKEVYKEGGATICYKEDGYTRDCVKFSNREIHYKEDGKTVDYFMVKGVKYDANGIKSNFITEARKHTLPKWLNNLLGKKEETALENFERRLASYFEEKDEKQVARHNDGNSR